MRHWRFRKTFPLSGIDLGEALVLEIKSDIFQPLGVMDGGANRDPRVLGLQVRAIRCLRVSRTASPPQPLANLFTNQKTGALALLATLM
jgi:hypothetical protein